MSTVHINGADVHSALLIMNIASLIGYIIQCVIFATIVHRHNTQVMLSRQPSVCVSSSQEGVASKGDVHSIATDPASRSRTCRQMKSSSDITGDRNRGKTPPLTERQRIARTKLILLFGNVFFASVRGIDVTAIYTDAWVIVRYLCFTGYGIFSAIFWAFYIYQHMTAYYVASFGDLRGTPRWAKLAATTLCATFIIPTPILAIVFFSTRLLIFHTVGRLIQSSLGLMLAVALAIFVYTIVRHMEEHQEKMGSSEDDVKRKQGIRSIRRFGYSAVAVFLFTTGLTWGNNIPDLLNSRGRRLEEDAMFGPRENRDPTNFKELQLIFVMFIFVMFAQYTQWISKEDVNPSQKTSSLQTATSNLVANTPPNHNNVVPGDLQSPSSTELQPIESGANSSSLTCVAKSSSSTCVEQAV